MKKYAVLIIAILMISVFAGCSVGEQPSTAARSDGSQEVFALDAAPDADMLQGYEQAVSRAVAARMLALARYDTAQIDALPRTLTDYSPNRWYDKYINALSHAGLDVQSSAQFSPHHFITLSQARELLDAVNPENTIRFEIDEHNRDIPISLALWNDLYHRFVTQDGSVLQEVSRESLIILAEDSQLWQSRTSQGGFISSGMNLEAYIDTKVSALIVGNELLAVLAVEAEEPTLQAAYIVDISDNMMTINAYGVKREYMMSSDIYFGSGVTINTLANVTVSRGEVLRVETLGERFRDKVLRKTGTELELLTNGTIRIGDGLRVFSIADGEVEELSVTQLFVGMDDIDFYLGYDSELAAALIRAWPTGERIRVAISTSGFGGLVHRDVSLRSPSGATLSSGTDVRTFAPNEQFSITADMFGDGATRVFVTPSDVGGMVQIMSVTRHGGVNPSYLGMLEISRTDEGFHIINELGMDEYLWGVVPSEMPTYFGEQAAKVQAITARSYAFNQLFTNRYAAQGANVCDSVNSQVYNNIAQTPLSIAAVNATSGRFLIYGDRPISANYFSVSSGHTANSGEVWARGDEFPSHTPTYLRSVRQHDGPPIDMRVEENARAFFQDLNVRSLDMNHPWFRWNVELTAQEIAASINANLLARYNANPALIRTLQPDGSFASVPIDTIGELRDLEVTQRGEGGNIMEMRIEGSLATILVQTEFNVRSLIQARQFLPDGRAITVNRHDGSTAANHGMMPSAFYSVMRMTAFDGTLESVRFYGGGSGHGAGMSHAGVRGMTQAGATYEDILRHFYFGTAVARM